MELAQALVQLWQRKIWLVVGLVVAALAAFGSRELLKSKVYAAATTQMVVDSPQSALSNIAPDLAPLTTRAGIYAQLMTSPPAVDAIGRAAGIPGAAIAATGPPNAGPSQTAQQPAASSAPSGFKLLLNQDPSLPTIDVYTEAPTTRQAIALANGAVSGFASYLRSLERPGIRPAGESGRNTSARQRSRWRCGPGCERKIVGVDCGRCTPDLVRDDAVHPETAVGFGKPSNGLCRPSRGGCGRGPSRFPHGHPRCVRAGVARRVRQQRSEPQPRSRAGSKPRGQRPKRSGTRARAAASDKQRPTASSSKQQ